MNEGVLMPESSGAPIHTTTARREWCGWFGVMAWLFCMINGYYELPNGYSDDNIFWCQALFQILFVVSVIAVSFWFGRDPNGLARLACITTPVAIAITAAYTLIPQPAGPILFVIAPVFMAPVAVRRAYGILRAANPGHTLFAYMSGVAAAFLCLHIIIDTYEFILNHEAPILIAYLIFAVFAFLAWFGVTRRIDIADQNLYAAIRKPSKSYVAGIVAIILLAFWLRLMNNFINYAIEQYDDYLFVPVYIILPPVVYLLCGWWGDKGYEKKSVMAGLILLLVTIQFAFFAVMSDSHSAAVIPLVFVNHFIGIYLVYFIITISNGFQTVAKRPVFTASLGFACYLAARLFTLITGRMLPDSIKTAGAPLLVSTAVTSIAFFCLLYFIYQRQQERTLAAALNAFLHGGANVYAPIPEISITAEISEASAAAEISETLTAAETPGAINTAETQGMINAGLTREEIKVAQLLIDGVTQRDIGRKLHLNAATVGRHEKAIREKLNLMGDPDPVVAAIIAEYKLTKRETDILKCLRDGLSTEKTAAELYIAENTVRFHISNLLKKLGVEKRMDLPAWLDKRCS